MTSDKKPNKNKPLLLIAEDEEIGIFTIQLMLESRYNMVFARNGKEAIELYFAHAPDVVLMDIMMPEVDGFEAFKAITSKRSKTDKTGIIAVTARAMKQERDAILQFGFDEYVSKPIDDEELIQKIDNQLNKLHGKIS